MQSLLIEDIDLTAAVASTLAKLIVKDNPKLAKIGRKQLARHIVSLLNCQGAFSDLELEQAIATGNIVSHPLVPKNIKGSSIDVTLGRYFYGCDRSQNMDYYNPRDSEDVMQYFGGRDPKRAILHEDWVRKGKGKRVPFRNIPLDASIIVLRPRERILAHTHEFIGIRPPGTCQMQARSSVGRNGVSVCIDAGWGDPGYINRWTMEVYNWNDHKVVIVVGERIAQMVFYHTGEVRADYGITGKYQDGTDSQQLVDNWKPEMMLPRTYNDKLERPLSASVVPINFEKIIRRSLKKRGLGVEHLDKLAA